MIRILTDSSCEFEKEELKKLNIECIPLKVKIEDIEYLQTEINNDDFYDRLETCKELPKTSQPSPYDFEKIFKDVKEKKDTLIVILISSELSGTIQAAYLAKDLIQYDDIHIVDSESTIGAMQILLYECARLRDKNVHVNEIVDRLNKLKKRICLLAIVDTLEYLKKGGRLSSSSAMIGNLLHIKPIVTINGKVQVVSKAIGSKLAIEKIVKLVNDNPPDINYEIVYGYSYTKKLLNSMKEKLAKNINSKNIKEFAVGPVIGTHVGKGAAAIVYVKKEN